MALGVGGEVTLSAKCNNSFEHINSSSEKLREVQSAEDRGKSEE